MKKLITATFVAAALIFLGAGCVKKEAATETAQDKYADLTEEQRSECASEGLAASLDFVYAPEDRDAPARMAEQLQTECLDAMARGRTYNLIRFPNGDESEGVAGELQNSLERPYRTLSSCKTAGSEWKLAAEKSDRRAYFECRTTCAADEGSGGITCEGTAYTSPRYMTKTTVCLPEQRGVTTCPQVLHAVCATVNIQCITTPCDPIRQTFRHECEACKNPLVSDYVFGACPEDQ